MELQTAETRSDADVPDLDFLHRGVVELLEAGDDYRIGYAAPFRHRGLKYYATLRCRCASATAWATASTLVTSSIRNRPGPEIVPREPEAAALAERATLERHPARGMPLPAAACTALPGRTTTDYLDIDGAQVLVRSAGEFAGSVPLFVLPHAPGSSFLYDALILVTAPALSLDFPGHGESRSCFPAIRRESRSRRIRQLRFSTN